MSGKSCAATLREVSVFRQDVGAFKSGHSVGPGKRSLRIVSQLESSRVSQKIISI